MKALSPWKLEDGFYNPATGTLNASLRFLQ